MKGGRLANKKEEILDDLFFAISDPSRRKILSLLREANEMTIGDLADAFEMSLNGVSKHVKILEKAGVVTRRIEWRTHTITPNWETLNAGFEYLSFYHNFWNQRMDSFVNHMNAKGKKDE